MIIREMEQSGGERDGRGRARRLLREGGGKVGVMEWRIFLSEAERERERGREMKGNLAVLEEV